jgi:hypothetical protein
MASLFSVFGRGAVEVLALLRSMPAGSFANETIDISACPIVVVQA